MEKRQGFRGKSAGAGSRAVFFQEELVKRWWAQRPDQILAFEHHLQRIKLSQIIQNGFFQQGACPLLPVQSEVLNAVPASGQWIESVTDWAIRITDWCLSADWAFSQCQRIMIEFSAFWLSDCPYLPTTRLGGAIYTPDC